MFKYNTQSTIYIHLKKLIRIGSKMLLPPHTLVLGEHQILILVILGFSQGVSQKLRHQL